VAAHDVVREGGVSGKKAALGLGSGSSLAPWSLPTATVLGAGLSLSPGGCGGGEGNALLGDGVGEGDAVRVQAEGHGVAGAGEGRAAGGGGIIGDVSHDGMTKMLEVKADLVGATCSRMGRDQRGAIGETLKDVEARVTGESSRFVNAAGAETAGFIRDGSLALEGVRGWVTLDASEVAFFDFSPAELRLEDAGEVLGLGEDNEAGGVGVQAMGGARFEGVKGLLQDVVEGVPIEAPARMHGQRGGFVQHDEGLVFVDEVDLAIDVGLAGGGVAVQDTLASVERYV
jgi:hypothetical protein